MINFNLQEVNRWKEENLYFQYRVNRKIMRFSPAKGANNNQYEGFSVKGGGDLGVVVIRIFGLLFMKRQNKPYNFTGFTWPF